MKTKRILSLICVLALVLSMCSVFSFATAPEAEVENGDDTRSPKYCYVKTATWLYPSLSGTSSNISLSVGEQLEILSNHSTTRLHVRRMNGTQSGYVLRSCVIQPG